MRLKILGNMGGSCRGQYSSSALINDSLLLDVGTGAQQLSLARMLKIDDVLLTHSHLDHMAMLFFLMDCQIGRKNRSLQVHCLKETAVALRRFFFNDHIWPDFENIKVDGVPIMEFNYLTPYQRQTINGCDITPLPVQHTVPTVGYCLHGDGEDFVFISDILDADDDCWEYLNNLKRFRRMTIEISFPDEMEKVAKDSFHLTPKMLERLLKKIPSGVEVFFCHAKPQVYGEVLQQVEARFVGRVKPLQRGMVFYI